MCSSVAGGSSLQAALGSWPLSPSCPGGSSSREPPSTRPGLPGSRRRPSSFPVPARTLGQGVGWGERPSQRGLPAARQPGGSVSTRCQVLSECVERVSEGDICSAAGRTALITSPSPRWLWSPTCPQLRLTRSGPVCSEPAAAGTGWKLYTLSHLILTTAQLLSFVALKLC